MPVLFFLCAVAYARVLQEPDAPDAAEPATAESVEPATALAPAAATAAAEPAAVSYASRFDEQVLEFIQVWKDAGSPANDHEALSRAQRNIIDEWAEDLRLITDGARNKSQVWREYKQQENDALLQEIRRNDPNADPALFARAAIIGRVMHAARFS